MKHLIYILFLFSSLASFSQGYAPVNKAASPEAKKLLKYIYSIYGKQILSGQHNYNENMDRFSDSVQAFTGKRPAVWGTDFIWNGTKDPGQRIVDESIKKHKEGYLITLMWHQGRPTDNPPYDWKESIQGKLTDTEWKQLITPGTELNKRWLAQIDQIAEHLKKLKDANVPILWRPYHEMMAFGFGGATRKAKTEWLNFGK
ncbi:MAG: hypothetical protein JWQ25_812 [Daejeonella sp.]|nr:hypothetical protein [Daejeonella sp.]